MKKMFLVTLYIAIAVLAQKTAWAGWSPYFTKPLASASDLVEIIEKGDPKGYLKLPLSEYKKQKMTQYNKDRNELNRGYPVDTEEELLTIEKTMFFSPAKFKKGDLDIYRVDTINHTWSTWQRSPYSDESEIKSSLNNQTYQLSTCGNLADDNRPSSYTQEVRGDNYDSTSVTTINDTIINRYIVNETVVYQTSGGWYSYNQRWGGYYYYPYRPYWFWNYGCNYGWHQQPNITNIYEGDNYYSDDDYYSDNDTYITYNTIEKNPPIDEGEPGDNPTHDDDDGTPSGTPTHDDPPVVDDDGEGPTGTPTHDDGGGMQGDGGGNKTANNEWLKEITTKNASSMEKTFASAQSFKGSGNQNQVMDKTSVQETNNSLNTPQTKSFAEKNPSRVVNTTQAQKQASTTQFAKENPSREYLIKQTEQKKVTTNANGNVQGKTKTVPQVNNQKTQKSFSKNTAPQKSFQKSQPQQKVMPAPRTASVQNSGGSMAKRSGGKK